MSEGESCRDVHPAGSKGIIGSWELEVGKLTLLRFFGCLRHDESSLAHAGRESLEYISCITVSRRVTRSWCCAAMTRRSPKRAPGCTSRVGPAAHLLGRPRVHYAAALAGAGSGSVRGDCRRNGRAAPGHPHREPLDEHRGERAVHEAAPGRAAARPGEVHRRPEAVHGAPELRDVPESVARERVLVTSPKVSIDEYLGKYSNEALTTDDVISIMVGDLQRISSPGEGLSDPPGHSRRRVAGVRRAGRDGIQLAAGVTLNLWRPTSAGP